MERNNEAVFISGGTSGIGFAMVKKYLTEGYFVVVNYHNGGMKLESVLVELGSMNFKEGDDFILFQADISREKDLLLKLGSLHQDITNKLTTLINNAAVLHRSSILELTQDEWINVFNVNVFSILFLSKWFYKNCPKLTNIVNIGSIRGESPITRINNAAYSISKSTIPAMTALQAKTFGPKVRVNAIIPGTIDTPQRQGITSEEKRMFGESNSIIKRLGKPEEIAEFCYFITSSKCGYMTGSSLVFDGGYSINYIR